MSHRHGNFWFAAEDAIWFLQSKKKTIFSHLSLEYLVIYFFFFFVFLSFVGLGNCIESCLDGRSGWRWVWSNTFYDLPQPHLGCLTYASASGAISSLVHLALKPPPFSEFKSKQKYHVLDSVSDMHVP